MLKVEDSIAICCAGVHWLIEILLSKERTYVWINFFQLIRIPNNGNIIILFQSFAIPQVLQRKNTLISAETGNGKTLAFIGPMLQQIKDRIALHSELPFNSPLGLVIVPGKELAAQIHVSPSVGSIPYYKSC